jgi:DNA repair protein RadD
MELRDYQSKAVSDLWDWFRRHDNGHAILELPTGSGKSLILAEICRQALTNWPGSRILMTSFSKEIIEQNLDKLLRIWPDAPAGVHSASLNRKDIGNDILYTTIGSIYKKAHLLGKVDLIIIDECHMCNTANTGMYRQLISDLQKYCPRVRVVGLSASPFRGNGVFLTAGDEPLFTGIASRVTLRELFEKHYLSPLVSAGNVVNVTTGDGISIVNGDYNIKQLAEKLDREELVDATCRELLNIGKDRHHWIIFGVTIEHVLHIRDKLIELGVTAAVVSAKTPKNERERIIADFKSGKYRALINCTALGTGFDAEEIDLVVLMRNTRSPVLYIQMLGRGLRLAPNKIDCLVADFTDTIATLGPIDTITGRMPKQKRDSQGAPYRLCPECGSQNPTGLLRCADCGHEFPEPDHIKHGVKASDAPVLSTQIQNKIVTYPVTDVRYSVHKKPGSPDSLRVDYWSGLRKVASEWIHFERTGWARAKAEAWWKRRGSTLMEIPLTSREAFEQGIHEFYLEPSTITVNETGKFPEIIKFDFSQTEDIAA